MNFLKHHKPYRKNDDYKKNGFESYIKMETIHRMFLPEPWFGLVKKGKKNVECIVNRSNAFVYHPSKTIHKGNFSKGHIILWFNDSDDEPIRTRIVYVKKYKTFYDFLKKEKLENALPINSIKTIKDGLDVYRKYYDESDQTTHGVLALKIKRV